MVKFTGRLVQHTEAAVCIRTKVGDRKKEVWLPRKFMQDGDILRATGREETFYVEAWLAAKNGIKDETPLYH
jgi:hypothetical protein